MHEPLILHDAPATGQIWTIDPIFLSIFPIYGVIYHALVFGILDQSLHVFQNYLFHIEALRHTATGQKNQTKKIVHENG